MTTFNVKFDFLYEGFPAETDAVIVRTDLIKLQRFPKLKFVEGKLFPKFVKQKPDIIHGRTSYEPLFLKIDNESINKTIKEQLEKMQDRNRSPDYKFNVMLEGEDERYNLIGCFIKSVRFHENEDVTIELSIDYIP